jgi:hypothetical protein
MIAKVTPLAYLCEHKASNQINLGEYVYCDSRAEFRSGGSYLCDFHWRRRQDSGVTPVVGGGLPDMNGGEFDYETIGMDGQNVAIIGDAPSPVPVEERPDPPKVIERVRRHIDL